MVSSSGSLVQSCCGAGRALQTNVTGVCGGHSPCSGHTGFAPTRCVCAFPSILLRLQVDLQGAGPELHALPRPKPLRFQFSGTPQNHRLGWACILCLPCLSSSGSQELDGRTLPGCGAPHPPGVPASVSACTSCTSGFCLFWGAASSCDPPGGCQPSRISEVFG